MPGRRKQRQLEHDVRGGHPGKATHQLRPDIGRHDCGQSGDDAISSPAARIGAERWISRFRTSTGNCSVAAASWQQLKKSFKGNKTAQAGEVGKLLAQNAKQAGIEAAVFDRAGYLYHGRVKALADAAREGGLKF